MKPKPEFEKPKCYQIRVLGHIDHDWNKWFDQLEFNYEDHGITRLSGVIIDQSQLHGLLNKIRDLGLTLISVTEFRSRDRI